MTFIRDIFDIIDILLSGFLPFIYCIFNILTTKVSDLTDTITEWFPDWSGASIIARIFDSILNALNLEDITLFGLMFGGGVLILVLLSMIKWILDIIPLL